MKKLAILAALVAAAFTTAAGATAGTSERQCSRAHPCANPACAEAGYGTDDCDTPDTGPPAETPDGGPAHTKLCYSHFSGSTPWTVPFTDAPALYAAGETIPIAVSQAEATKRGIPVWKWEREGDDVLVCTLDGLHLTGQAYNGDDPMIYGPAFVHAFQAYWQPPFNLYQVAR